MTICLETSGTTSIVSLVSFPAHIRMCFSTNHHSRPKKDQVNKKNTRPFICRSCFVRYFIQLSKGDRHCYYPLHNDKGGTVNTYKEHVYVQENDNCFKHLYVHELLAIFYIKAMHANFTVSSTSVLSAYLCIISISYIYPSLLFLLSLESHSSCCTQVLLSCETTLCPPVMCCCVKHINYLVCAQIAWVVVLLSARVFGVTIESCIC